MVKLFLLLTLISFDSFGMTSYRGPLGDQWETYHVVTIKKEISLNSSLLIRTDKLILEANIITNGFKLDIDAREIVIRNNAKILAFNKPQQPVLQVPFLPTNMGKTGLNSMNYSTPGQDGGTGPDGDTGFIGLDALQNPSPITVKALSLEGKLDINGNGQQGGKGGKGGQGGKGGKGGDGLNG